MSVKGGQNSLAHQPFFFPGPSAQKRILIIPQHLYELDLCLRLRREGVENVFTPFCRATCSDRQNTNAVSEQCPRERTLFQERWRAILIHHPYLYESTFSGYDVCGFFHRSLWLCPEFWSSHAGYNENRLFEEQGISRNQWMKWVAGAIE